MMKQVKGLTPASSIRSQCRVIAESKLGLQRRFRRTHRQICPHGDVEGVNRVCLKQPPSGHLGSKRAAASTS